MELARPGLAVLWRNPGLRPIGQPKAIGGVAVGIASTSDRGLRLVGLDPATGRELWRQPITPSLATRGIAIAVDKVGDDKVAYFRPADDYGYSAELIVADARTGNDLAKSPETVFSSPPSTCFGSTDVCAISRESRLFAPRQYRLEIASGRYLPNSDELPVWARLLTITGLYDLGDRPGNTLGLIRNGKLRWHTRVSEAFPPDYSSDNGWTWHLFTDQHVFAGSVYGESVTRGREDIRDLSHAATAGLSETTGKVLWRDLGSDFSCNFGNCDLPVRCRRHGIATSKRDRPTSYEGLTVTIEGFNPATGQTTWSIALGADERLVSGEKHPPIAGPTHIIVTASTGPVVLDYLTGQVWPVARGATFWCMTPATYEFERPRRLNDGSFDYTRDGGALATICDDRGQPATALPSPEATIAAGAHIANHIVIATQSGYVGFKLQ